MKLRDAFPCVILLAASVACASHEPASAQSSKSKHVLAEDECLAQANAERIVPPTAPQSIEVSQVLVRHKELRHDNGSSRTRGEACLRALSALKALQDGASWDDVVSEYSDAGRSNAGALGTIQQDEVTPNFARAAFSLDSNELSYVVETDRGFHIILRH